MQGQISRGTSVERYMDFYYNVYTTYGRPGGSVGDLDTF